MRQVHSEQQAACEAELAQLALRLKEQEATRREFVAAQDAEILRLKQEVPILGVSCVSSPSLVV